MASKLHNITFSRIIFAVFDAALIPWASPSTEKC